MRGERPTAGEEILSDDELAFEMVMLRLRTLSDGSKVYLRLPPEEGASTSLGIVVIHEWWICEPGVGTTAAFRYRVGALELAAAVAPASGLERPGGEAS